MLDNLKYIGYSPKFEPGPGGVAHRKRVNKFMGDLRDRIKK
jgi:hypothetical protein